MSDSSTSTVTFRHPFRLPGMPQAHKAGTFDVVSRREYLDVPWDAYRVVTSIMLTSAGLVEAWPVTLAELETAISTDERFGMPTV